jgi:hypothetical protein
MSVAEAAEREERAGQWLKKLLLPLLLFLACGLQQFNDTVQASSDTSTRCLMDISSAVVAGKLMLLGLTTTLRRKPSWSRQVPLSASVSRT